MMWHISDFLGIEILDYVVMSNHYHQLLFVPGLIELSDKELLERLRIYYGDTDPHYLEFHDALAKGDKSVDLLRVQYLKRMGNISELAKILKQSFTCWYNWRNKRKGTLWMGRFGSVLAENSAKAAITMAAYIDLNPVRASLVDDPKDYPYCGYAAALAGSDRCRKGIMKILQVASWEEASKAYRVFLIQRGSMESPGKSGKIDRELLLKTLENKGKLSIEQMLHLKVRYFTDGLVFGSEKFVEDIFQQYRSHFGEKRKSGARQIRGLADSQLRVIRDLKKAVFE